LKTEQPEQHGQKKKAAPNPELWPQGGIRVEPLRFRRAPLLAAAIWFAMGEVLARTWQPALVLLAAVVLLVALVLVALRWQLQVTLVPLAALWIVVGFWSAEVQSAPPTQAALIHYADGLSRTVRGRVVRVRTLSPRKTTGTEDRDNTQWHEAEPDAEEAISVDLQVQAIEDVTPDAAWMTPISGGVRTTMIAHGAALPALRCGDIVEAPMQLRVPERYHDPGAWQYADYLLAQGIGLHSTVRAAKVVVTHAGEASLQCRLFAAQAWAAGRMTEYVRSPANHRLPGVLRLSTDDAGMLDAMLFGDRSGLTKTQRLGFERTGSFHLFVVSGMHVALLAGAVFWLARRLLLSEWLATLLTLTFTASYALLTGFGAPVQRALWMTAIFLAARLFSRERNVLNALGAAALGVLVWSPSSLFEASFQMTFLAIVAIGGIAVPLGERSFLRYARAAERIHDKWVDSALPPQLAQFRVMLRVWGRALAKVFGRWAYRLPATAIRVTLWAVELALIGLVAELVMVLPMAMYFHRATMFALPANMVSVPLVAVVAPAAVCTFVASLVSPWLAAAPGAVTALLLHGITAAIGHVSSFQAADVRVPGPTWWVGLIALAGWGACCWLVRRSRRGAWVVVGMLPLIATMVLWPARPVVTAGVLEVTAIDVGQGDSLLVVSPEGRTMLVDAGGPVGSVKETAQAASTFDVGEEVVSPYLWSRRMRRLDVMVLSHAHSDHMGGMAAVMRSFRPRELWVGIDPESEAYRALLREAVALGVTVRHLHAGDAVDWSGVGVKVLAPESGYVNRGEPVNNDSLVLRLQYGEGSALLEGDAEAPSERAMLANGRVGPVTLLKVGHHGSRTSTTEEFFAATTPKDAVVSVGRGNTFGHPRPEVVARIAAARTRLYRTDEFGLTTFLLERDGSIREVVEASNP
jgi:competence protein ComEC